jgi:Ca2+-transporting ATPase
MEPEAIAEVLHSSLGGLPEGEAAERLRRLGPNRLPSAPPPSRVRILVRQFRSPLIYILIAAAGVALALGKRSDAVFIAVVLAVNAAIGFANEWRAERAVRALAGLVRTRVRVRRGTREVDVDGETLVPGDLLFLESGGRLAADVRLFETRALRIDESLLTGESVPVDKDATLRLGPTAALAERRNMGFAGSVVASGRGLGLVVATGAETEVGAIAGAIVRIRREPPPLVRRMERFARVVAAVVVGVAAVLVALGALRGEPFGELLLAAVALAVSAVPEGLPIALTVALAVAVSRMARRRVVVRHLPAVEALGSCSVIATDKTGTLTRNELTVERVAAGGDVWEVTGIGYAPEGAVVQEERPAVLGEEPVLFRLLRAGVLANEASLSRDDESGWEWTGDPTDVALLSLAHKAGCDPFALREAHPLAAVLPFEPERRFAASFHCDEDGTLVCVKGAPERVLGLCASQAQGSGGALLDVEAASARVDALMREGYRVLALAEGRRPDRLAPGASPPEPDELVFLGLVAMTDPPREGVPEALSACARAGIRVVMVTGDHATTAAAIGARIGLGPAGSHVLTGAEIAELDEPALRARVPAARIVARATPSDKLRIVQAWQARGELVAVTGDGVNDAPALRQADLGVAMGRAGTDVAREAADLVIADDDFSTIVAGVEEGRIAYDNVRKVVYLLISTGAGEVLLVAAALLLALPIPFTAAQLLWLNLVTNGIQDVALAFEPCEPGVLDRPVRPTRERIFDRLMIERTLLAAVVFAGIGVAEWTRWLGADRSIEEARNLMVQLFVAFEIFHIGNARSETRSLFVLSPLGNPVLLLGSLGALGVHLAAMQLPFLRGVLGLSVPSPGEVVRIAAAALTIVLVMELHKLGRRLRRA